MEVGTIDLQNRAKADNDRNANRKLEERLATVEVKMFQWMAFQAGVEFPLTGINRDDFPVNNC